MDSFKQNCRFALLGHSPFGEFEDQIAADPQRLDLAFREPFPEPFLEIVLGQRPERGENRTRKPLDLYGVYGEEVAETT